MRQQGNNPQHQRQQGRQQGAQRPWWAPPKTRGEAVRSAYRETRPEYLPVKRQLHQEIKASGRRQHEIGNWWNQYLQTVAGNQAATQQAYNDAAAQQQAFLGQASSIDNANTQRLDQQAQASAALRGQSAPTAAIDNRAAAAQAQRNYLGAAQGSALAAKGANQYAYLGERSRIGAGQRVKSMMEEQARGRGLRENLLAAKKEQGGAAVKNFKEAADRYREEALKRKAFGLEKQTAGQEAGENARKEQREREKERAEELQQQKENRWKQRELEEERQKRHHEEHEGQSGGLTPSARHNAWATAKSLYEQKAWPSWAALETHLRKETEVTPAAARWAIQRLKRQVAREEAQHKHNTEAGLNAPPHGR